MCSAVGSDEGQVYAETYQDDIITCVRDTLLSLVSTEYPTCPIYHISQSQGCIHPAFLDQVMLDGLKETRQSP
jgi:hypothetical protein